VSSTATMYQTLIKALEGLDLKENNNDNNSNQEKLDKTFGTEENNKTATAKTDTYVVTVTQVSSSSNSSNSSSTSSQSDPHNKIYEQPDWFEEITEERKEVAIKAFKRGYLTGSQLDSEKSKRVFVDNEIRELNKNLIVSRKQRKVHTLELQRLFVAILKEYFYTVRPAPPVLNKF